MEFIIAVAILVVLAMLAIRFGHDSRDGIRTKEDELARLGITWDSLAAGSVPACDANPSSEEPPKHASPRERIDKAKAAPMPVNGPIDHKRGDSSCDCQLSGGGDRCCVL